MEFTNSFHVPVDVDTTFDTLTDLEKVAPCLPGATLEEVDGADYTGRVKVKVGPVSVTYRGTATMAEADKEAKRARIEASGKEARGSGTAKADVVATMEAEGDGTTVTVVTDLNVTGKPAQFGRGVMADVGARIIDTFADRLRDMLTTGEAQPEATAAQGPGPEAEATGAAAAADTGATVDTGASTDAAASSVPTGPRRIASDPSREGDALNLMDVAGPATLKRVVPAVGVLALLFALIWWFRRS